MLNRLKPVIIAFVFLVGGAFSASLASAQQLSGRYDGIDNARGLTLTLSEAGGQVTGRIQAPDGSGENLSGRSVNGRFESVLTFQGRPGRARLTSKPVGISVVWSPLDASGSPAVGQEVLFVFRRGELTLPQRSAAFRPPPVEVGRNPNPLHFLNSYDFWEPEDVARVYPALRSRFRVLMEFHPALRVDIIWKLCQSEVASDALGSILRGTGVTCARVVQKITGSQSNGQFNTYKALVHRDRDAALYSIECAVGIHTPETCAATAQLTQAAAVSTETVATVLQKF